MSRAELVKLHHLPGTLLLWRVRPNGTALTAELFAENAPLGLHRLGVRLSRRSYAASSICCGSLETVILQGVPDGSAGSAGGTRSPWPHHPEHRMSREEAPLRLVQRDDKPVPMPTTADRLRAQPELQDGHGLPGSLRKPRAAGRPALLGHLALQGYDDGHIVLCRHAQSLYPPSQVDVAPAVKGRIRPKHNVRLHDAWQLQATSAELLVGAQEAGAVRRSLADPRLLDGPEQCAIGHLGTLRLLLVHKADVDVHDHERTKLRQPSQQQAPIVRVSERRKVAIQDAMQGDVRPEIEVR
mmetsp:Transcript_113410/g.315429  ORF Transcript_113410/g.315429 Transcript_113410/m.315429 type:complete len:298 (+) Transcript_113410:193-1086(+)